MPPKRKPVLKEAAKAPSGWDFVRAKVNEAEQRASGSNARVLVAVQNEGHDPELVKRARVVLEKIRDKRGANAQRAAKALRVAAKAALVELRKGKVDGADDDEESSWTDIFKVAERTISFGAALFFAWLLYKILK